MAAAERLPFPPTAPRPPPPPQRAPRPIQEKLIEAVRLAVAGGENLIAEAPTGSGKTAAALYPALAGRARQRAAGRLPDVEDAPAEDGRLLSGGHERARVPH